MCVYVCVYFEIRNAFAKLPKIKSLSGFRCCINKLKFFGRQVLK